MNVLQAPKESWTSFTQAEMSLFSPYNASLTYLSVGRSSNEVTSIANSCTNTWPAQPCCVDPSFATIIQNNNGSNDGSGVGYVTSRQLCDCWGGFWRPYAGVQYDNIMWSVASLFAISTTEGWVTAMFAAVDANGIDMQPVRDNHRQWIFFFIFYMNQGQQLFFCKFCIYWSFFHNFICDKVRRIFIDYFFPIF